MARTPMAREGPPIDWNAFYDAGWGGRLLELLMKLPRERWAERDEDSGTTLLHHACCGPSVAAVVALLQRRAGGCERAQQGRLDDHSHGCCVEAAPRAGGAVRRGCGPAGERQGRLLSH